MIRATSGVTIKANIHASVHNQLGWALLPYKSHDLEVGAL